MKRAAIVIIVAGLLIVIFGASRIFTYTSGNINVVQPDVGYSLPEISPSKTVIKLPAVDEEGNGIIATLSVEGMNGNGKTLVDINQLFFWVDTQYSIRTAKHVAENITGMDLSKVDLVYAIETNASVIEGQSAGAALAIATIAVLKNKTLRQDVIITGTINSDGTIGPIGGVLAKAKAAKDIGATFFLVPNGQGMQTNYIPERKCEKITRITICTTEYRMQSVDISMDSGIDVREVSNVEEALKYFAG